MMDSGRTRRSVVAAATAFTIVPAGVLARAARKGGAAFPEVEVLPPSERLSLGFVGVGGRGKDNLKACARHHVHALCDVDSVRAADAFRHFSRARRFSDWRVMLEREAGRLDGVVVSTPDHSHAAVTMAAMRLGLAVYTEKPLTRTISEARALAAYAAENGMVTQMGNQGHATEGARLTNEWIRGGLLGEVREVHCWTDRPCGWWPQGVVRPAAEPTPWTLNWEGWLGPAPRASYSSKIAPFKWRGYWAYGSGALGDMAAHIMDHPVWALRLGAPVSVEVEFEREDPLSSGDTFPVSTKVTYEFAARGALPPVTLRWFDGHNKPPRPDTMSPTQRLPDSGVIYHGSRNSMMHASHGGVPRLFPETSMRAAAGAGILPEKTMARSPGHHEEWLRAVKANDPEMPQSNFSYAGPLTEMMLLGCVATRLGPGTKLAWDSDSMRTDHPDAERHVHHAYRKGWSL